MSTQNKTETSPNKQVNALGLQLNLYFLVAFVALEWVTSFTEQKAFEVPNRKNDATL